MKEKNLLLFKFCCNIFIGVRIIKEMPSSVASGTSFIIYACFKSLNKLALPVWSQALRTPLIRMLFSLARNTCLAWLSGNLRFGVKKIVFSSPYGCSLQSLVPYYTRGSRDFPAHCCVFLDLSAQWHPAQAIPSRTQTLLPTVTVLLAACRLHLYLS